MTELTFNKFPGEEILTRCLQKTLQFFIQERCIKSGKLLLYKPNSFGWTLTLASAEIGASSYDTTNFEIPMPLKVEPYLDENLFYFDYRILNMPPLYYPEPSYKMYEYAPLGERKSTFYDSILECRVL